MRRAAILFAAMLLSGCFPEQGRDVAACQGEAARFYQTYKAVDPNDPSSKYIIECMAEKGYDFTVTPADCDSRRPMPTQGACYAPTNWFAGIIDQLRRWFTS